MEQAGDNYVPIYGAFFVMVFCFYFLNFFVAVGLGSELKEEAGSAHFSRRDNSC